jgi:regulator of replication initiation timing
MAWDKMFTKDKKETEVPNNPEKKIDAPPEKTVAEVIAESLKPLTESVASLTAQVTELKKPAEVKTPIEKKSVLEDEDEAFNQRLTPILAKTLEMEARMAKDDVEKEYKNLGLGDLWDANRKEIDDFLFSTALVSQDANGKPVPLRGNPEYIRNVADMVIGRTARKSGIRFDGKDKKFFLEDATGDGANLERRHPLEQEGITAKQIAAAKRFGIPIKDYAAAAKKLDFVQ